MCADGVPDCQLCFYMRHATVAVVEASLHAHGVDDARRAVGREVAPLAHPREVGLGDARIRCMQHSPPGEAERFNAALAKAISAMAICRANATLGGGCTMDHPRQ